MRFPSSFNLHTIYFLLYLSGDSVSSVVNKHCRKFNVEMFLCIVVCDFHESETCLTIKLGHSMNRQVVRLNIHNLV